MIQPQQPNMNGHMGAYPQTMMQPQQPNMSAQNMGTYPQATTPYGALELPTNKLGEKKAKTYSNLGLKIPMIILLIWAGLYGLSRVAIASWFIKLYVNGVEAKIPPMDNVMHSWLYWKLVFECKNTGEQSYCEMLANMQNTYTITYKLQLFMFIALAGVILTLIILTGNHLKKEVQKLTKSTSSSFIIYFGPAIFVVCTLALFLSPMGMDFKYIKYLDRHNATYEYKRELIKIEDQYYKDSVKNPGLFNYYHHFGGYLFGADFGLITEEPTLVVIGKYSNGENIGDPEGIPLFMRGDLRVFFMFVVIAALFAHIQMIETTLISNIKKANSSSKAKSSVGSGSAIFMMIILAYMLVLACLKFYMMSLQFRSKDFDTDRKNNLKFGEWLIDEKNFNFVATLRVFYYFFPFASATAMGMISSYISKISKNVVKEVNSAIEKTEEPSIL